jgi:transmembrane sensor
MKPHANLPSELRDWLKDQAEEERLSIEEAWTMAGHGPVAPQPDSARKAAVWATLEAAMDEQQPAPMRRLRPDRPARILQFRPAVTRWIAAAAAVVILFGVGLSYVVSPVTVTAPYGETVSVDLPDGSRVDLNSGSVLEYGRAFASRDRRVRLEGEAFFDVVPSPQPFVVATFNANTTVLGTRFNVRARRDEVSAATSVVVSSGRVRLASSANDEGVDIEPGQSSLLAAGMTRPAPPDSVSVQRALAWRTGGLAFSDQPFRHILAELERRFDVRIVANGDFLNRTASYWRHEPAEARLVLADITLAAGLRYREMANGFEVYAP